MKTNSLQLNLLSKGMRRMVGMAVMVMTIGSINVGTAKAQVIGGPPIPFNRVVYAAKFVCGFKPQFTPPQSKVLLGPAVYNYRDFEPGSYATALNVFFATGGNTTTNIDIQVSVPETPHNSALNNINLGPLSISSFGTVKVDCEDIAQALSGALPQVAEKEVIEGVLYITRRVDDLTVKAVYSYSSQIGSLGGEPINQRGVGLGSSIDVQNIQPKSYRVQFEIDREVIETPFNLRP